MKQCVATIGFFDGVHRGHQYLIRQVLEEAERCGMEPILVTFNRHPREVVCPDYVPQLLSTLTEKKQLLEQFSTARIVVLDFTPELSQLTAPEFMQQVLRDQYNVRVLMMGYDHRFGHGGGTHEEYVQWGKETGIEVLLARELQDEKVSSSAIRRAITEGQMEEANHLLGYTYLLQGDVIGGHQVGRTMGFPTANLQTEPGKLLPQKGVYAVVATLPDGSIHPGMLNIGSRPTMQNGTDTTIEVNLLHFTGNLYGLHLQLQVVRKLRDERRFDSKESLRQQLLLDAQETEHVLATLPLR